MYKLLTIILLFVQTSFCMQEKREYSYYKNLKTNIDQIQSTKNGFCLTDLGRNNLCEYLMDQEYEDEKNKADLAVFKHQFIFSLYADFTKNIVEIEKYPKTKENFYRIIYKRMHGYLSKTDTNKLFRYTPVKILKKIISCKKISDRLDTTNQKALDLIYETLRDVLQDDVRSDYYFRNHRFTKTNLLEKLSYPNSVVVYGKGKKWIFIGSTLLSIGSLLGITGYHLYQALNKQIPLQNNLADPEKLEETLTFLKNYLSTSDYFWQPSIFNENWQQFLFQIKTDLANKILDQKSNNILISNQALEAQEYINNELAVQNLYKNVLGPFSLLGLNVIGFGICHNAVEYGSIVMQEYAENGVADPSPQMTSERRLIEKNKHCQQLMVSTFLYLIMIYLLDFCC